MNHDYEEQLESRIDRELKGLPVLKAPDSLQMRVLATIAARNAVPARSARALPLPVRVGLFSALAAVFAAVCYGVLHAGEAAPVAGLVHSSGGAWQAISLVFGALQTVLSALVLGLKNLGTPILVGLVVATLLSYFTLVGVGTVLYRLTFGTSRVFRAERL